MQSPIQVAEHVRNKDHCQTHARERRDKKEKGKGKDKELRFLPVEPYEQAADQGGDSLVEDLGGQYA